ncbi:3'(2'),5'-bisphosphate nucleotidase CysQ [Williamsia sp. CHRR-6]|nr:3'(2'),5'-bisphosphate nucleotidase CysQ [Williamsia sp. CHRR-6]
MTDVDLAAAIAVGAGRILVAARHDALLTGRRLGDLGDSLAQDWIAGVLAAHRPKDAVLSEEATDSRARLDAQRVWIIDPLDGTREYAAGTADWAVHVALTVNGQPTDCAVSLPERGEVFRTDTVDTPAHAAGALVMSRFGGSYESMWVAARLGLRAIVMGSAGAKAMAVVRGDADAYIHGSGQYEWDNCAPVGVARAAGLHCSRLDGSPLRYNRPSPYMSDFLICRPELAEPILRSLAEIV